MNYSKEFLANVLKHAPVGISVQHASGRLVYANDAAAQSVGLPSAEAMLVMPATEILEEFEMLDESRRPFALDQLPGRRALKGEQDAQTIMCYRTRATGEERWSVVKAAKVLDEQGNQYAVNAWYDVSDFMRGR